VVWLISEAEFVLKRVETKEEKLSLEINPEAVKVLITAKSIMPLRIKSVIKAKRKKGREGTMGEGDEEKVDLESGVIEESIFGVAEAFNTEVRFRFEGLVSGSKFCN